jgi:CHAD domain-containing protein
MGGAPSVSPVPRAVIQPDLPIADSARLALAIGVAAMKYHEDAAIAGGIEPLHQMRVATRRLRATVGLFAGVIHGARARIYNRDLPWLGQAAGEVRECDMIEALVRDCSNQIDPAFAAALAPLTEVIAASRNTEHTRFVNDLRTKRYQHMCEKLADPLLRHALPAIDVGCNAPAMIEPIARSVRKAGKRISRDAPPELFHRLRVKIKRFRYALEMLIDMGGKRSRKALIRLEEMQELLGLQQDAVSTMTWLRKYAGTASGVAPETLMAVGATIQVLTERRQKLAAQACRQWRRLKHSGVIQNALEEISRAAQHRLETARQARAALADEANAQAEATGDMEAARLDPPESSQNPVAPMTLDNSSLKPPEETRAGTEAPDPSMPESTAVQPILPEAAAADSPPAAYDVPENGADASVQSAPELAPPNESTAGPVTPDSSAPADAASEPATSEVAAPDQSTPAEALSNQSTAEPLAPNSSVAAPEVAATPEPSSEPSDNPPAPLHHNTES